MDSVYGGIRFVEENTVRVCRRRTLFAISFPWKWFWKRPETIKKRIPRKKRKEKKKFFDEKLKNIRFDFINTEI